MTPNFAAVFPGQGSQAVGMLSALASAFPAVTETFEQASGVLGFDLWRLVQEGPIEALNQTENTQPALLAAGVAVWRVWQAQGGTEPSGMAGHSLGEYTALVCAEALGFEEAVALVRDRGRLMQAAVPAGSGGMAAILGLDNDAVRAACAAAAQGEIVEAVNFNAPGQVVIAGQAAAVQRAIDQAKALGAKRAIPLPVSVPSHCALMIRAAALLRERLAAVSVRTPHIPVLHNVNVAPSATPDELRDLLGRQLHCPVRWAETVRCQADAGMTWQLEFGPGKVLTGLGKRIDERVRPLPVFDPATLTAALEMLHADE